MLVNGNHNPATQITQVVASSGQLGRLCRNGTLPVQYLYALPFIIGAYIALTQWAKSLLIKRFGLN